MGTVWKASKIVFVDWSFQRFRCSLLAGLARVFLGDKSCDPGASAWRDSRP